MLLIVVDDSEKPVVFFLKNSTVYIPEYGLQASCYMSNYLNEKEEMA